MRRGPRAKGIRSRRTPPQRQTRTTIDPSAVYNLTHRRGSPRMLKRSQWLDGARKLDWTYSYVREEEVFPEVTSGRPWLPHDAWAAWDEPYRTTFAEYVSTQASKDAAVVAV